MMCCNFILPVLCCKCKFLKTRIRICKWRNLCVAMKTDQNWRIAGFGTNCKFRCLQTPNRPHREVTRTRLKYHSATRISCDFLVNKYWRNVRCKTEIGGWSGLYFFHFMQIVDCCKWFYRRTLHNLRLQPLGYWLCLWNGLKSRVGTHEMVEQEITYQPEEIPVY